MPDESNWVTFIKGDLLISAAFASVMEVIPRRRVHPGLSLEYRLKPVDNYEERRGEGSLVTDEEVRLAWSTILDSLAHDPTVTPPLFGFASLIEPKGVITGTFYLEVPDDYTRSTIEERLRGPLLQAIGALGVDSVISTFAVVVNPELAPQKPVVEVDPAPPTIKVSTEPVVIADITVAVTICIRLVRIDHKSAVVICVCNAIIIIIRIAGISCTISI